MNSWIYTVRKLLAFYKIQKAFSKICTRVIVYISPDDNF